jgi:hypothetical protein
LNNINVSSIGDATGLRGSTADGSIYLSLHTSDPGETALFGQSTNETSYTDYARVAVERTVSGWTVTDNSATNSAPVIFPSCGTIGATITHFGIGTAPSGEGKLIYKGALSEPLIVSSGIAPLFATGTILITED